MSWSSRAKPVGIPVTGTTLELGQDLLAQPQPVTLHLVTDTFSEARQTKNVLADTDEGDQRNKIVVGARLDSVAEGPGINDNGSGSAFNLELAIAMAKKNIKPENRVRFAWWGAEESGLVGATRYVAAISDEEFAKIARYQSHATGA